MQREIELTRLRGEEADKSEAFLESGDESGPEIGI